jgi:hypothetical protein
MSAKISDWEVTVALDRRRPSSKLLHFTYLNCTKAVAERKALCHVNIDHIEETRQLKSFPVEER